MSPRRIKFAAVSAGFLAISYQGHLTGDWRIFVTTLIYGLAGVVYGGVD